MRMSDIWVNIAHTLAGGKSRLEAGGCRLRPKASNEFVKSYLMISRLSG